MFKKDIFSFPIWAQWIGGSPSFIVRFIDPKTGTVVQSNNPVHKPVGKRIDYWLSVSDTREWRVLNIDEVRERKLEKVERTYPFYARPTSHGFSAEQRAAGKGDYIVRFTAPTSGRVVSAGPNSENEKGREHHNWVSCEYTTQWEECSPPEPEPPMPLEHDIKMNKQLRKDLDSALQQLKSLPASRERSLSITKVQEAIMWLGMDLKRLGGPNPYPNSYNPNNAVVDPTAEGLKL